MPNPLTPQILVWAYSQGIFPMAPARDAPEDEIEWFSPDPRAIMPLDRFHVSRRLARRIRRGEFRITRDADFHGVISGCSEPRPYTEETWINDAIINAYTRMHEIGHAHSVEAWDHETGELVGGIYGLSIGAAFFGESMFSRRTDASKVCLAHLVEHLRSRGYALLDVQLHNTHIEQFGIELISRDQYLYLLQKAIVMDADFT